MIIVQYRICKKDSFHLNGEPAFAKGQKYQYLKKSQGLILMKLDGVTKFLTMEYFKENFKQAKVY